MLGQFERARVGLLGDGQQHGRLTPHRGNTEPRCLCSDSDGGYLLQAYRTAGDSGNRCLPQQGHIVGR